MLNVLVTGGAGYIGYSLVEKLEASDDVDRIYVLDNLVKGNHNFFLGGNKLRKTQFIKGEILDHHGLSKVLDKVQIVYHLAAHVSFPYSHEENLRYEQINQWGTSILSQEIAKYENIEKVIYLSSAAVYGQVESADIDTLPQPNNDYGRSKLEGEKMIRLLGPSKKVTIVRSANVFGYNPCIRLDAVLNQFIFKALTFGKVHIYGDGTQYRPFVSLDVLCDLLMDELRLDSQQETKNVVEFNASMNEIVKEILNLIPEMEYIYVNQNQKFQGLRITPTHPASLANSIAVAIEAFKKNLRFAKA